MNPFFLADKKKMQHLVKNIFSKVDEDDDVDYVEEMLHRVIDKVAEERRNIGNE